jgi:RNA polymerase sigma-70 factor (ECF subfamily)
VSEEVQLLSQAKALDEAALTLIHEQNYDRLFRYISFRVGDRETAEDLTSDVFTRFLRAIRDRQSPPNTIQGWLFGAANLVLKEHYRHKKRQATENLTESMADNQADSPEDKVSITLENELLKQAMDTLTEEQQQVLALRFGYNMPIRDVAHTVNKSEGSVKMLQVRAIAALAKQLGTGGDHE